MSERKRLLAEMYTKYLKRCEEKDEVPVPFDQFKEAIDMETIRRASNAEAREIPTEDWQRTLYVSWRCKTGIEPPTPSTAKPCAQCGEAVWVDNEQLEYAGVAAAIICQVCLPEVTGKTVEDERKRLTDLLD